MTTTVAKSPARVIGRPPVRGMCADASTPLIPGMDVLLEAITEGVFNEKEAVVLEWRVATLARAGFDLVAAVDLACDKGVDLHAAVRLVERGCPPETALRILL